jgi:photosystem II stability/assembly factor-like uncharacterized protein
MKRTVRRHLLPLALCLASVVQAQWEPIGPFGGHIRSALSHNGALLVGTSSGIYRSTDGGQSYSAWSRGIPSGTIISLAEKDGLIYACIHEQNVSYISDVDGIYTSADGGITWDLSLPGRYLHQQGNGSPQFAMAGNHLFVRSYDADSLYFTADGANWTAQQIAASVFDAVQGAGSSLFCQVPANVLGPGAGLYRSTDSGMSWQPCSGVTSSFECMVHGNGSTIYAFAQHVYASTDGGATFTQVTTAPNGFEPRWWCYDGTDYYFSQGGNAFLAHSRWQPGESGFTPITTLPTEGNTFIWYAHEGDVFLSRSEHALRSSDQGASWQPTSKQGMNAIRINDLHADEQGLLAVSDSMFCIMSAADSEWSSSEPVFSYGYFSIARSNAGIVLGGTTGFDILQTHLSTDQGANWVAQDASNLYVPSMNWKLLGDTLVAFGRSANSTGTNVSFFDLQGDLINEFEDQIGGPSTNITISDLALHDDDYYALSAATNAPNAHLMRLDLPTGLSWTTQVSQIDGAPFDARALCSFNGDLYLGMADGSGVKVSSDNGSTWSGLSDGLSAQRIHSMHATADRIFLGTRQGVHYLSDDGTEWFDISMNLPAGDAVEIVTTSDHVWARMKNGGVWRLPLYGNVGIEDRAATGVHLNVFPNPATETIRVRFPANSFGDVEIADAQGRIVLMSTVHKGEELVTLEVGELIRGLYTIRHRGSNASARFVVN